MNMGMKWLTIGLCIIGIPLKGFGEKTIFGTRSQGFNAVRELAGWQRHINRPDQDANYFTLSVVPEYDRSFHGDNIACFLLGGTQFKFSGSQVPDRGPSDILADYFGLPSDFVSTVYFNPTIVNFVMDFDCFIGLDGFVRGLYARIHFPLAHTKWDLNLCECITDAGTTFTSYPAGYLSANTILLTQLTVGPSAPTNVQIAFEGNSRFGDMQDQLKFGKIWGRQNDLRVADLTLVLGYNFLLSDWYHFGLNIRTSAPTGTLRKAEFLFEPIAGNDHHWELGGGLSTHVDFWKDEDTQRKIGFYVDANITHLFDSTQKRSFDLCTTTSVCCTSAGSRYMLLEQLASPAVALNVGLAPNNQPAPNQYIGRLLPAINITTVDATISVGMQADVVAKLYYQHRGFEFDIGYDFWARSKEKLSSRCCIPDGFALKGDAQVYGFTASGQAVALNATQDGATINAGQGAGNFVTGVAFTNANADNPNNASDNLGTALFNLTAGDAATFHVTQQAVQTSSPAILISNNDIDECSALLPRALSNKIFSYIGYTRERAGVVPYMGVGTFVEWAHTSIKHNSAYSQWGVWFKGGLSY
jgi:hypothetical protein